MHHHNMDAYIAKEDRNQSEGPKHSIKPTEA